jgi:hypothetical protein
VEKIERMEEWHCRIINNFSCVSKAAVEKNMNPKMHSIEKNSVNTGKR